MNFITVLMFLGIIGTFTVFFGITALTNSGDIYEFEKELNSAVYENEDLKNAITELNFKIFHRVDNDNVIVGADGFLFEHTDEKSGYGYLLDYQGELAFSEAELEKIKSNIELRRSAYESAGCEYLLVVIPNSQTVYSENMPFYYGAMSDSRRLSVLSEYLSQSGTDCFFDVTSELLAAKKEGLQYNNTENSLNALGAYTVYSAIIDRLGAEKEVVLSPSDFYRHLDTGRAVARSAKIEHIVYNKTVSLSLKIDPRYEVSHQYENFKITTMKGSDVSVLVEYGNEWNRVILQPYLSNTFGTVAYKYGYKFSEFANSEAKPDTVIQIVCENELDTLFDEEISMSYCAAEKIEGNEVRAAEPKVLGSCFIDSDTVCIYGICEEGSEISVLGGRAEARRRDFGGRFYIDVDIFPYSDAVDFRISAEKENKKSSDTVIYKWKKEGTAFKTNVDVGAYSMLFNTKYSVSAEDFRAESAIKVPQMRAIREITQKNTRYIYTVVPSKLTVYKNYAPGYLLPVAGKLYGLRADIPKYIGGDVEFLDLTEHMLSSKRSDLYYRTDNVPTDSGAYEIYLGIVSSLGLPVAVQESELVSEDVLVPGGKLIASLGLDTTVVCERTERYTLKASDAERISLSEDGNKYFTRNKNGDLPTALIFCDEYGKGAAEYLSENFSFALVYATGDFMIDPADLAELRPDYIIRITGEDNIG